MENSEAQTSLKICQKNGSFFNKICCVSHVNVGIMKLLNKASKLFQRPVFCKRLAYITLICNLKAAIRTYSRNLTL